MTAAAATTSDALAPVRKSITVSATVDEAFRVFTDDIDSWWPRSHHIGKVPMKRVLLEGFVGGRCYTEQIDGTDCPWGSVLVWEPPSRFVIAWQIDHAWGYVADLSTASEVDVRFTAEPGGKTRVHLEHRHFERMGPSGAGMRAAVDDPNGWNGLLALYAASANSADRGSAIMKASWWLRALAVLLALFAIGHTLGTAAPHVTRGASEAALFAEMKQFRFPVMGYERSYWDFYRGFALTISLQLSIATVIAWQLSRLAARDPRAALPMTAALSASSLGMLVLGRLFFFNGPIVLSLLATIVSGVALVLLVHEASMVPRGVTHETVISF